MCVVCGFDFQTGHIGDGCSSSSICLYMSVVGDICSFRVGPGYDGLLCKYCFVVMYGEWYGGCDFVVLSVV